MYMVDEITKNNIKDTEKSDRNACTIGFRNGFL